MKYAMLLMREEKGETTEGIESRKFLEILLNEQEIYKYIRLLESDSIMKNERKEKLQRKHPKIIFGSRLKL